jgi:hypothetical protein
MLRHGPDEVLAEGFGCVRSSSLHGCRIDFISGSKTLTTVPDIGNLTHQGPAPSKQAWKDAVWGCAQAVKAQPLLVRGSPEQGFQIPMDLGSS